jgi:hypothetical protein
MIDRRAFVVWVVPTIIVCFGAERALGQGAAVFEGTFQDDRLTVIAAADSAAGKSYSGTIVMVSAEGNRRFPFQASEQGGELVGRFVVGDKSFDFHAAMEKGLLVFRTGENFQTEYRLARVNAPAGGAAVTTGPTAPSPRVVPRPAPVARPPPPPPPPPPGSVMTRSQSIERAIQAAKTYVYSLQKDGNWDRPERSPDPRRNAKGLIDAMDHAHASQWGGLSALATYALLASGDKPEDDPIANALSWLATAQIDGTYALACRALVWSQLPARRRSDFLEHAKRDRDMLLNNRRTDPRVAGMFHYKAEGLGFDHSNSQFGVLGLWAVEQCGAEVDTRLWKEFEQAWMRTQLKDGGWSYSPLAVEGADRATPSMTAAGVASLFIATDHLYGNVGADCRGNVPHKAIDAGMRWIAEHYDQTFKGSWPIYTLYGMERIGLASGYKSFGTVDWYASGVDYLLANQRPDGSWGTGLADTCFGILFLVRGRAPVVMNKLEYAIDTHGDTPRPANWHQRPRDCANLVRWMGRQMERELAWQIVNLKGPVEGLHDSPILFVSGNQALSFTNQEEQKLAEFVRQGGLIVGHADCGQAVFSESFKRLGTKLFSPYEFRNLPKDHLINTILFDGRKWKNPPQVLGLSNGARELMLLIPIGDPGRYWQNGVYAGREASHELMANVYLYVSENKQLRNRGESNVVTANPAVQTTGTIKLARLEYGGNWDPEPGGWRRLAAVMHNEGRVGLEVSSIKLGEGKLASSGIKLAHLTGTGKFILREEQRKEIRDFVAGGGTLIADACGGGGEAATAIESELAAMFPGAKPAVFKPDHPLYGQTGASAGEIALRPFAAKLVAGKFAGPRLRGIEVGGRTAVIFSPEDLSVGLVGQPVEGIIGYTPASATALVKGILLWQGQGRQ